MKAKLLSLLLLASLSFGAQAQSKKTATENIVLVTFDGLRWQELFKGADSLLIDDTGLINQAGSLLSTYWDEDPIKRREMLFPFFWSTIAKEGQLFGNRAYGNMANNMNKMWFSYPGYNEFLSGFSDDSRINSNNKFYNPNLTLLEYLNQMPAFKGKVMAFASWDVFPFIINTERSGIPVNAGFDIAKGNDLTDVEKTVNRLQQEIRGPWGGVRLDAFTQAYALEAIKKYKPKVLYVAYGETDDWAHDGKYDQYLLSATQTDKYIQELWNTLQADPQYKDKTTMLISVDHGRGITKESWKSHGARVPEGGEIWLMAIGPDTPAGGEMKMKGQWSSAMVARTVYELLGLSYPDPKAASAIKEMIK
jgi:hypothetical protein